MKKINKIKYDLLTNYDAIRLPNSYASKTIKSIMNLEFKKQEDIGKKILEIFDKSSDEREAIASVQTLYDDNLNKDNCYYFVSTKRLKKYFNAYKQEFLTPDCSFQELIEAMEKHQGYNQDLDNQKEFLSLTQFYNIYSNIDEMIADSDFDTIIMPRTLWRELCCLNPTTIADFKIYNKEIDDDTPITRCKRCGSEIFVREGAVYIDKNNSLHFVDNNKSRLFCQGCNKIIKDFENNGN